MREALLKILFAVLCGVVVAGLMYQYDLQHGDGGADAIPAPHLPYPHELQTMLRAEGYDIAIDGIIGNETLTAWHDYAERHSNEMSNQMTAEAVREEQRQ